MTKNRLKIRAHALDLELTGDTAYIEDAYMAMRQVIMERFQNTLATPEPAPASASSSEPDVPGTTKPLAPRDRQDTNPMYKAVARKLAENQKVPENTTEAADTPLHTVICGDVYFNVSIVSRGQFDKSIFGRVLTSRLIERVYVNEVDQGLLSEHLTIGKVLWRELTPAGQSVIGRGGGKP
jgi:hypothetical protein